MILRTFLVIISISFFSSCSKSSGGSSDVTPPVIMINSPVNNQVFNSGDNIAVTGTITDAGKVVEVHVHIYNNDNNQLLEDIHRYPSSVSYSLNESFIAQSHINYKIQVVAKDNSANQSLSTVLVSAN